MMNKTKSGLPARFKAALVAPFAILLFFLFADFTLKGSSIPGDPVKELDGLWIKQSKDDFSDKILIKNGKFSFTDETEIKQYDIYSLEDGKLTLRLPRGGTPMKYSLKGEELIFSWNMESESSYTRSKAENTLDLLLLDSGMELDLPHISRYRLLEKESQIYRIGIGPGQGGKIIYTVNGKPTILAQISAAVSRELGEESAIDAYDATCIFLVDQAVPMSEVIKAREELLEATRYRIAEGGYPHGDMELSPLLYHAVALPRLLPPKDAKVLDKEEVEKSGGKVHTIDLSARNTTPRDMDEGLRQFIAGSPDGKYVISLEYEGDIPYGQYVETVDMIYNVVYSFRFELAQEKYGASYDKLGDELQKEIRKAYPIALSENLKEGQN